MPTLQRCANRDNASIVSRRPVPPVEESPISWVQGQFPIANAEAHAPVPTG
jgi:hypothetical protein